MEKSILLGGFGGQGVQTIGKLLTYAANEAKCEVTFFPAYGGQMRGGTSNCTVVVSDDKPIFSPNRKTYDYIVALNEPSYKRFAGQINPGGTIVINSDLVTVENPPENVTIVKIPLNTLAEQVGSQKVMNVIMLGFLSQYLTLIPKEAMLDTVHTRLGKKAEYAELNNKAFALGASYNSE